MLAKDLDVPLAQAESVARHHIGVCYDACHMAVEFEEPAQALGKLKAAGIKICKFQISSALKLRFQEGDGRAEKTFLPFAESETDLEQRIADAVRGVWGYDRLRPMQAAAIRAGVACAPAAIASRSSRLSSSSPAVSNFRLRIQS